MTNTLLSTGAVLSAHTATYDPVGNRLGVLETINTEGSFGVTYSYDPANQLVSEIRYGLRPYSNTFTYDPAGNQLTITPATGVITTNAYNAANAVILSKAGTAQPTTLTYDAAGNRLTQNAAGSLTTFTWNYENRNTLLVSPSGVPLTNIYDAAGLRRSDGTNNYIWDRQNLLQIRNVVGGSKTFQFTGAPNVYDGVVSQYEPSGSDSQFYAFDMTGSNRVATHVTGGVTSTLDYTSFGTEYYVTGGTNMMNRFGGKWGYFRPSPSGLLYIQQRWLDVVLAQWLGRDRSGFQSGWNWYKFVNNNPVTWVDPTGMAAAGGSGGITSGSGFAQLVTTPATAGGALNAESTAIGGRFQHPRWPQPLCSPSQAGQVVSARSLACGKISAFSPASGCGNALVCPTASEKACLMRMCSGNASVSCGGPGCAEPPKEVIWGYVPVVGSLNESSANCDITICANNTDNHPQGIPFEAPGLTNIQQMALAIIHEMLHCCGRYDQGGPSGSNPAKDGSRCVMGILGLGYGG